MKYVIYAVGIILVFVGSFVMHGWLSWVVVIVGVILTYVPSAMSESEVVGETDKTTLFLLLLASNADGKVAESEGKYIQEYIRRRGLSEKQVKAVMKLAEDPTKFRVAEDKGQRLRLVDEVIGLVKADGKVTDEEKKILEIVADAVKLSKEEVFARLNK